jgi:hypothetical protein
MIQRRTFRAAFGWAPVVAAVVAASAVAQDSSPQGAARTADASQPVDEVIVRGRRMSEIESDLRIYIDKFLEQVAKPSNGRGYARWNRSVCVGVHNLEATAALYVVYLISLNAF